jgi:3-phenylpropionate/cinnamic acid dioxygenase small subunit
MMPFDAGLRAEIAWFVEAEARLLDDQQFDAWLALFDSDCRYWVPVSPMQQRPGDGVAHFNDDKQLMAARTHRLLNPRAFGAEPSPRTAHVVSGIRIDQVDPDGGVVVSSSPLVLEYRRRDRFEADSRVFGGRVTHRLRRDGDGWRITEKRVDLVNAEGSMNALAAPF